MHCYPQLQRLALLAFVTAAFGYMQLWVVDVTLASPPESEARTFYEDRVELILERRCYRCHNSETKKANLDLSNSAGLIAGGDSGPVVIMGHRDGSLLYEAIREGTMPPEGEPLLDSEIDEIGHWIAAGLEFREPPSAHEEALDHGDVLPVFLLRCTACHGAELKRGGLDLRSYESVVRGGDSGPAMIPGDVVESLMIQRVEQKLCPPQDQLLKYFVKRPSADELDRLRKWIDDGARAGILSADVASEEKDPLVTDQDRQHWAFKALPMAVEVPAFDGIEFEQPIDAFIFEQLKKQELDFSPRAERSTLIRRVYFDLIGMPPTLVEWQRWSERTDDGWYAAMIDELLTSPKYGERWGRYWLDVAGYSDSEGGVAEDVVREVAWKYRDYVIRAHNEDKPWDRFLMEQLAGDELADYRRSQDVTDEIVDQLIATGFLRMGVDQTGSRTMNFVPERVALIADALNVVGSGVLGLTVECARCHSHKYDPIPQRDYYRLKAVFQGAFDEYDWMSWKTRFVEVATPEMIARQKEVNPAIEKELKKLDADRKQAIKSYQDPYYEAIWPKLSADEQQEILAAIKDTPDRRTLRQDELVTRYETEIRPMESVLIRNHSELAKQLAAIDQRISEMKESLLPPLAIRALWDRGRPSPTFMLIRGEYDRPGKLVGPGVPSVLTDGKTPFRFNSPTPNASSTGRRLAFAHWLTESDHPLTARVLVNRVWKHHFGQGIVATLDNFGLMGAPPTHPQLLDWLARDFVQTGWSLKSLHRKILLSRTYQQSSYRTPEKDRKDPLNRWLSRMTMGRLDAEAIRDSLLTIAGRLDDKMFGPPARVDVREDGLIMDQAASNKEYRRSIYLRLRRTEMPSQLAAFDYPEMQPNCSQRTVSTVSPQALMLSNNSRIHQLANDFSQRILSRDHAILTFPADLREDQNQFEWTRCVECVYRTVLSRSPSPEEMQVSSQMLGQMYNHWYVTGVQHEDAAYKALASFCHTMFNSAEFLYID